MQAPVEHQEREEPNPELAGGWLDIITTVLLNAVIGFLLIVLHAVLESR